MTCHASLYFYPVLLLALGAVGLPDARGQMHWPSWRGPHANGHAEATDLPATWTQENILWKTSLPGDGQSSPIVWGDRIFLTSSRDQGNQRIVFCVRRTDGRMLWQQVAWEGEAEPSHVMNGWASASCATDGERVMAFFGKGGLHCYAVAGSHLWSRDLGPFEGPWGTAASPLIVRDRVIQNCDADADAYLIAVDKTTGADIWKTARPAYRGWSSPIRMPTAQGEEIILNGHTGVSGYDLESGSLLWTCRCERGRGSPTATPAHGRLYLLNGLSGGGAYCVQPGGSGDVTATQRQWIARRGGRDLSSPIVLGKTMLAMGLRSSILTAYDTDSGEQLWNLRIGGQISASPIAFGGKAFFIDETGKTRVIDPDSEAKLVATNTLGETGNELFRASITPCRGQLLIRSNQNLYCIAAR